MTDGEQPPLGDVWPMDWPEEMDVEERVRSVASTLRQPRTTEWIASRADVDVDAAREVVEGMVFDRMWLRRAFGC